MVANGFRRDVFVCSGIPFNGGYMNSAFVCKCAITNESCPCVERHVGDSANETCSIAQPPQTLWATNVETEFQFQIGNNRTEICIATALAVTVDRALHM